MRIEPIRQAGYELFQAGAEELARVESNGIRIDIERLERTKEKLTLRIRELKQDLEESSLWQVWRRRFGREANLTSSDQLAVVLYQLLGYPVKDETERGQPSVDEEALQKIDHPDLPSIIRLFKYNKALGTYLNGIQREIVGDHIYPFFNLHLVRSYRSSSDTPNFQNFPVRDVEIAKIIRRQFIASEDSVLVENDFKGVEVALSAAYHHDPVFIDYISTPGKDMHRDMAAQIYMLDPSQVSKEARYGAKNKFVFPQFYGDFYLSCARSLWDWIERGKLKGPKGDSLYEHLDRKGIYKLGDCDLEQDPVAGTFEHHLKEVEKDFWERRFMVYGQWRKDWYEAYLKKGYFDILTGFRVYGAYSRNAVTNYPVQGAAFHCTLWSLIQVNRALRKYRMRSKLVGQIHDSLVGDVRIDELQNYLEIVEQVTMVDLRRQYPWLVVAPDIEYEICLPGDSWFEKKPMLFKDGRFVHPTVPNKFTTDAVRFLETMKRTQV